MRWLQGFAVALLLLAAALAATYLLFPRQVMEFGLSTERRRSGLELALIEVGGRPVAYLHGGAGEPLLLIHGFGADKDNWIRIGKYLTPHFRVYAIDLPGFGDSPAPEGASYLTRDQVDRVRAIVGALRLSRPHLGGNSMGGHIAAAYGARFPQDVASLWLIAPGGVATAEPSEMVRRIQAGEPIPLVARTVEEFDAMLEFVFEQPPFLPPAFKRRLAERAIARRAQLETVFRDRVASEPLETDVGGLSIPTRIVWGLQDRVLHVSGADVLARLMPNASVRKLDGIGHLPMVEDPRVVAEDYLEFQQGLQ